MTALPPPSDLLVTAVFAARRDGEPWCVHFEGGRWHAGPGLPPLGVAAWYRCSGCGAIDAAAGRSAARGAARLRIARVVGGRIVLIESPGATAPSKGEPCPRIA